MTQDVEPPRVVSADVELTRNKFLRALVMLMIVIAVMQPMVVVGLAVFYFKLNDNQQALKSSQQLIVDCTDRRRTDSPCQRYQDQRTQSIVNGPFAQVVQAYVLCADKLDGDAAIKACVSDRLKAGTK